MVGVGGITTAYSSIRVRAYMDAKWMSAEVGGRDIPNVIEDGTDFAWDDLLRGFDVKTFDDEPRARFVLYFFKI